MKSYILLAATCAAALTSPAVAQDDNTAPPAAVEEPLSDSEGGEIVVTAQLREQRLVEVPLAITAYDGEFLEQFGIEDFEELSRQCPFSTQSGQS